MGLIAFIQSLHGTTGSSGGGGGSGEITWASEDIFFSDTTITFSD